MSDAPIKVHEALTLVMRDVGAIGKNRQADQRMGGYAFRGIDDLYNALHGPLVDHGVFFVPEVLDEQESSYQTSGGATMRLVRVRVRYRFYGPDGEHIEAVTTGEAADTGDKAANKAMTAALKYLLFQVLCIPTEDIEDADAAAPDLSGGRSRPAQPPPEHPVTTIRNRIKDAGLVDAFTGYLAAVHEVNRLDELDDEGVRKLLAVTGTQEGLETIRDHAPAEVGS